jgi:uncharacterized protein
VKIFLDTNVLASGFGTRGLCIDIIESVLESHDLIISLTLLSELGRTLEAKFGTSAPVSAKWKDFLKAESIMAASAELRGIPIKDKSDIILLSDALAGDAALFVTGDKELLELGQIGQMEIISPRTYWERFNPRRAAAIRLVPSKKDR